MKNVTDMDIAPRQAGVGTTTFDPIKGEMDTGSGHRRWVHDLIERRLKKAASTGIIDLSCPAAGSLVSGHVALQLDMLPKEFYIAASRLSWTKKHLKRLYLTNNNLYLVSPEIALFQRLTHLGLGGNALTSLPTEIGSLIHLEALFIEKNQLACLPDCLAHCTKLTQLTLDNNRFSTFPLVVTKCTRLYHLSLSHNGLTSVPIEIRRLLALVELNLDHNRIGPDLPMEMASLTRLQRLGLEGNCLTTMPACLANMTFTTLRLSGNRGKEHLIKDPITQEVMHGVHIAVQRHSTNIST